MPGADVGRREAELPHDLDRDREELGVGGHIALADDVDVELVVLAKPAALLPLIAEELRHREPPHRLPERVRPAGDHARYLFASVMRDVYARFAQASLAVACAFFAVSVTLMLFGLEPYQPPRQ